MGWTIIGIAFIVWFTLVLLFTPRIDYHVGTPLPPDGDDFLDVMRFVCQGAVHRQNRVDILPNGTLFYPAMRDAIQCARSSVHLEAYIMQPGSAADMLIDAMVERARAGVDVRVVLDAIGSARMGGASARRMRDAGVALEFYRPIRWYGLHRLNNRTHRELLVVDGRIAFTGGAGIADWWHARSEPTLVHRITGTFGRDRPTRRAGAWRDTMVRLEGPVVASLQGVFAENWLECCGEILTAPPLWPALPPAGDIQAMLVKSSPSDRATTARIVFQMLIDGARTRIDVTTPYFLPDKALRRALQAAARRGVEVRVVVPGATTDQRLVRLASRRMYGELLRAGVRIYEYRPAMIHAKALLVDDAWSVIGTTNMDNRSFEHNDEINVALRGPDITARFRHLFAQDLGDSDEVALERWQKRSLIEKVAGTVRWVLERQQ